MIIVISYSIQHWIVYVCIHEGYGDHIANISIIYCKIMTQRQYCMIIFIIHTVLQCFIIHTVYHYTYAVFHYTYPIVTSEKFQGKELLWLHAYGYGYMLTKLANTTCQSLFLLYLLRHNGVKPRDKLIQETRTLVLLPDT